MKANSTKQTFFNPGQYLPQMSRDADDLKQHSTEDFEGMGFNNRKVMNNKGYLKNQVELNHHREYQLASRVMYNAGIEVIKNNPDLMVIYDYLPNSVRKGNVNYGYEYSEINKQKARFVIFLGLEASKQQLGFDWVKIKLLQLMPNIRNYSIRPSSRIELANGEVLATDHEYFAIMHAFLKANDVDVSNYPVLSDKEERAYYKSVNPYIDEINFDYDTDYEEDDVINGLSF